MPRIKMTYHPVYKKILVLFIILIVPVYGLIIGMNEWGRRNALLNVRSSITITHNHLIDTLTADLNKLAVFSHDFINNNNDIKTMAYIRDTLSTYQMFNAVNRMYDNLYLLGSVSAYTRDVTLYLPNIDRYYTSTGAVSPLDKRYAFFIENIPKRTNQVVIYDNSLFLNNAYPPVADSDIKILLSIQFDNRLLSNVISRLSDSGGGNILYNKENSWFVSSSDDVTFNDHIMGLGGDLYDQDIVISDNIEIDGIKYFYYKQTLSRWDLVLVGWHPLKDIYLSTNIFYVWIMVAGIMILLAIIFFTLYLRRLVYKPINSLMRAFSDVKEGNLDIQISYQGNDEFHSLYASFNNMLTKLKTSIKEVYEQKILKQRAELKYLQSNINPHFLYNCFFTINSMALLEDYEKIPQITSELGKYYQYITSHTEEVTFEREYQNAKAYLAIQAFRFGEDRMSVKLMELPDEISKVTVPSIILQPILENAFKHGIQKKGVISEICMDITFDAGELTVTIENSPGDMDMTKLDELNRYLDSAAEREEVSGILNVHRRIRIKYGVKSGLVLSVGRAGGLIVKIVINYERNGG